MLYFRVYEDNPDFVPFGYGRAGARWNLPGTGMIYLSNIASLNYLEHITIRGPQVSGLSWKMIVYEIFAPVPKVDKDELPENWNSIPRPSSTQRFGSQWIDQMISPFLKVPSARLPLSRFPEEHNLLMNPMFPDRDQRIKVVSQESVSFYINPWF